MGEYGWVWPLEGVYGCSGISEFWSGLCASIHELCRWVYM